MDRFWNWTEGEGESSLRLEGPIAQETWFGDEVTPKLFREELEKHPGKVTVYINSPGGDVFAASEIYAMLMERKGDVTVKIDALAASAASIIAMAGGTVLMAPTAYLMIHDPMTAVIGNRNELKQAIKTLDEIKEGLINAYELKTGLARDEISRLMEQETWLSAYSAMELGFADGLMGEEEKEEKAAPAAAASKVCVWARADYAGEVLKRLRAKDEQKQADDAPEREKLRAFFEAANKKLSNG